VCQNDQQIKTIDKRMNIYYCGNCQHTFTNVEKQNKDDYSDKYYDEDHKQWFNNPNYWLFDLIIHNVIELSKGKEIKLLDVGCGNGDFLKYIRKIVPQAKLVGVDLNDNKYEGIDFIKEDFMSLADLGKRYGQFSTIVTLAVIEHIDDLNKFVNSMRDILQNNGYLIIMTINNDSLIYRAARLLCKIGYRTPFDRLYSSHHLQHFTNRSLSKLMEKRGFKAVRMVNHNYPLKAVDVPGKNPLVTMIFKISVAILFLLSIPTNSQQLQTIIYKKIE
jgi:SAM-dependent methyltransferase